MPSGTASEASKAFDAICSVIPASRKILNDLYCVYKQCYLHENKIAIECQMAGNASVASGASHASYTICIINYPLNLLHILFR